MSVAVDDVAVLTCSVSGTPAGTTVRFQWKKAQDMLAIPGTNSTTYQVSSSVTMYDMGLYTCEVTVSDEMNNPHVIPATSSVNITLTINSKGWYSFLGTMNILQIVLW